MKQIVHTRNFTKPPQKKNGKPPVSSHPPTGSMEFLLYRGTFHEVFFKLLQVRAVKRMILAKV